MCYWFVQYTCASQHCDSLKGLPNKWQHPLVAWQDSPRCWLLTHHYALLLTGPVACRNHRLDMLLRGQIRNEVTSASQIILLPLHCSIVVLPQPDSCHEPETYLGSPSCAPIHTPPGTVGVGQPPSLRLSPDTDLLGALLLGSTGGGRTASSCACRMSWPLSSLDSP